jgi:purine-binding chemotaxis protein CheW
MAGSSTVSRFLLVRARANVVALPLEDTVEVMRPLAVEAVSGMPAFLLGLSVIRGTPVPVVDLGALLVPGPAHTPRRFVTVRAGDRLVALGVESLLGIRELDASTFRELPPLFRDAHADPIAAIGAIDGKLLLVLAASRVVPETLWQTLRIAEGTS